MHDKYKRDRYEVKIEQAEIDKVFERLFNVKPLDAAMGVNSGEYTQEEFTEMRNRAREVYLKEGE